MEENTLTLPTLKEISLDLQSLIIFKNTILLTRKKFSDLYYVLWDKILLTMQLPLLTKISTETEQLFSLDLEEQLVNFNTKSNPPKLESIYLFQYPYLCSLSQEEKDLLAEIWISTEKLDKNSLLRWKLLLQGGKMKELKDIRYKLLSL